MGLSSRNCSENCKLAHIRKREMEVNKENPIRIHCQRRLRYGFSLSVQSSYPPNISI